MCTLEFDTFLPLALLVFHLIIYHVLGHRRSHYCGVCHDRLHNNVNVRQSVYPAFDIYYFR